MKKSELSIIGGLFIGLIIAFFTDTNFQADNIRKQTLRLHIIAQDDSAYHQQIKTQVKDVIVNTAASLYCRAQSYEDALQITEDNLEYLQQIADNTLINLGADYKSICSLEEFYFNTTDYEDFTMPRGVYTALTIRLGEAKGKNWWCVVYPSLCVASGGEYEDDDSNTFIETQHFRLKFKTVELWQNFTKFISNNNTEVYKKQ